MINKEIDITPIVDKTTMEDIIAFSLKIPSRTFVSKEGKVFIPTPSRFEYWDNETIDAYDAVFGRKKKNRVPRKLKKKLKND